MNDMILDFSTILGLRAFSFSLTPVDVSVNVA